MRFHFVLLLALYFLHSAIIAISIIAADSSTRLVNCISCTVHLIAGEAAFCKPVCQFAGAPIYTEAVRLPQAMRWPLAVATMACFGYDELAPSAANTPLTIVLVEFVCAATQPCLFFPIVAETATSASAASVAVLFPGELV